MSKTSPTLLWLRRDLRLCDHAALQAAMARGGPVIPVFIRDTAVDTLGAAPKWRLGLSLGDMAARLAGVGSRLILRSGDPLTVLRDLVRETGAGAVCWSRLYDPEAIARDSRVKAGLVQDGIEAQSHAGHLLFEPWTVETGTCGFYKVYSPFWRAVKGRDVAPAVAAPASLPAPVHWPAGDTLSDWQLGAAMHRGAVVCAPYQRVGEVAALTRLADFTNSAISTYKTDRDLPGTDGCSGLSENLTYGELSPRQCWHAGWRAWNEGAQGAEQWLKELVWREFAYHLIYHSPHITHQSWREGWDRFLWRDDDGGADILAWKQGRTGVPFVDAAMRELYVTGKMHNRARMIVASYLTKHMMVHWRVGQRWFEQCLTDWDPAANAMGWQWVAGCGPDAAPYFRVFNPDTQADKFDAIQSYRRRWIAEGQGAPGRAALDFFDAVPRAWGLAPTDRYPERPIVGLAEGRKRAIAAYEARKN